MTQLSKTTSTCETQWKMLLVQVLTLIYLISVCAAQEVTAIPTSDETTYVPPTTYDPPVPSVTSVLSDVYINEKVVLKCSISSSSGWTFTWEKNGQRLSQNADFSFQDQNSELTITANRKDLSGSYTCRGEKQGKGSKTSEATDVKVSEPPVPLLIRQTAWTDVFVGEAVSFKCEPNLPAEWKIIWHKNNQPLDKEGPSLHIESVTENDKGTYVCQAKLKSRLFSSGFSNTTDLNVKSNNPKLTLSRSPDFDRFYPEESISFTCTVDVTSEWKYQWYKDGEKVADSSSNTHTIASLKPSDKGQYHCKVQRGKGPLYESNAESVEVADNKPKPVLGRSPTFPTMYPGESISFTCTVDMQSGWKYQWYKDGGKVADSSSNTHKIASLKPSDKGQYHCKVQRGKGPLYESNTESVEVADNKPKPDLTRSPTFPTMYPGESINFTCTVDMQSGWEYEWYHRDVKNPSLSSKTITIGSVTHGDKGDYRCLAKRDQLKTDQSDPVSLEVSDPPTPILKLLSPWSDVFENEVLKFSCDVSSSEWTFTWHKNQNLIADEKGSVLNNAAAKVSDGGQYSCKAHHKDRRGVSSAFSNTSTVSVYDKLPTPTLSRDPMFTPMFIGETVKLKCAVDVSSGWSYHWYKDGSNLNKPGKELSIELKLSDKGGYSCEAKRGEKTSTGRSKETQLDVRDGKPTVTLLQDPSDKLMHTSDLISFTCHVNVSSGWKYIWYKDNKQFKSSGNSHQIASAKTSDSGSYRCQVERKTTKTFSSDSRDVELTIKERPKANIVLLTTWSEVFSTDSLKLECDVMGSSDSWNYTWYKEDINVSRSLSSTYKVTPHDDPEQSSYTCEGIRTERPMYSQRSDSYRTKNLLLKRRILLSISGCLFFGIIAVFIGCVALRIFRKPVVADDKQEETSLFLTMAQLKDRNDAPCPLVEYITDADVNPPVKEGEENGTSCSEATSLPITTPDEQAATANGKEATENGGGMVSFLQ
ncbi:carcinoembryonic antigen-related cell adhesion molecule 5-like isoform X3 [Gambusia affinis]|uniref:carcinoembryonic antigen-related cell adhesion molecule 5-like isoform X3 n=1 Tax=Gambusia affinis TaxID=33528 RepID=UPI001CDC8333|nr:carcinoembryonic antigen-related cell adhesion molecule 5-like isoform X3 [Gambusia affinis]